MLNESKSKRCFITMTALVRANLASTHRNIEFHINNVPLRIYWAIAEFIILYQQNDHLGIDFTAYYNMINFNMH